MAWLVRHDADIVLPRVPGRELAGEIVEVGKDVKNFKTGARVTVPFVGGCGSYYHTFDIKTDESGL